MCTCCTRAGEPRARARVPRRSKATLWDLLRASLSACGSGAPAGLGTLVRVAPSGRRRGARASTKKQCSARRRATARRRRRRAHPNPPTSAPVMPPFGASAGKLQPKRGRSWGLCTFCTMLACAAAAVAAAVVPPTLEPPPNVESWLMVRAHEFCSSSQHHRATARARKAAARTGSLGGSPRTFCRDATTHSPHSFHSPTHSGEQRSTFRSNLRTVLARAACAV